MSIHLLMRLSVAWTWWCLELPWLQPSTLVSVTLAKGIRKVNFKSFEPGCSNFYSQNFDSVMHKMLFMTDEYYLRVDWSLSTGFQMRQQLNLAFLQSLHWCLTSHGHDSAGLSTANHWNWRMLAMYFRHNVPKQKPSVISRSPLNGQNEVTEFTESFFCICVNVFAILAFFFLYFVLIWGNGGVC